MGDRWVSTAQELAGCLLAHEGVGAVRRPGLVVHPSNLVAQQHLESFGRAISFDVAGVSPAGDEMCRRVQLIRRATSFDAVESTFERRAAVAGQEHLPPGLPRLSVGLDHVEDLWNDMTRAI